MTKLYFIVLLLLSQQIVAQTKKKNTTPVLVNSHSSDTVQSPGNRPANINNDPNNKVIISHGDAGIEFSALDPLNNGVLIQPINRVTDKGISTAFYIHDTAAWSFFTNGTERLRLNGNGNITTTAPLLIKTEQNNTGDALRVNGNVRIDSIFSLRAASDSLSYISFHRDIKSAYLGEDDKFSPYTSTPTTWATDQHIPVFRIRHPNNVSSSQHPNLSVQRDFKILPYEFGMAIEFNGVVECWVGEWSVHRGDFYNDVEGKGNGWGGVSWVGDDQDGGGVRMTARNNLFLGGNVKYGEISVEKFAGAANGDFRLRLPSTENAFQFVYGGRGSENIVAKVSGNGFFIPIVSSVNALAVPEKGQFLFDSSANTFKGYNGTEWKSMNENNSKSGSFTSSATGSDLVYTIAHNLNEMPAYFNVMPASTDAANISYVTADATGLYIHYTQPRPEGTNNLSWTWEVKE